MEEFDLGQLVEPALQWYKKNKRTLPWRMDQNPYKIWVSEIMLQQTRVEAVIPYFERFMKELPTIETLAECPEDKLLKLWEGLGYYNRVRNMQKAAQVIVETYGGQMPDSYEEILTLPGIGPYTAGAIASISFGQPVPAVDGNVLRILARATEDEADIAKESTKKKVTAALSEVMPKEAGAFNQALMEIGALVCIPNGTPHCESCPWMKFCRAYQNKSYDRLPVKAPKKPRRIQKKTVFVIRDGKKILIGKRQAKGLLAGLYELPNQDGYMTKQQVLDFVTEQGLDALHIQELPEAKHIFSHIEWHMKGYMIRVADVESFHNHYSKEDSQYLLVEVDEIQNRYAIPSAFEAYVSRVNLSLGVKKSS